jgi:hypothetical protein
MPALQLTPRQEGKDRNRRARLDQFVIAADRAGRIQIPSSCRPMIDAQTMTAR